MPERPTNPILVQRPVEGRCYKCGQRAKRAFLLIESDTPGDFAGPGTVLCRRHWVEMCELVDMWLGRRGLGDKTYFPMTHSPDSAKEH